MNTKLTIELDEASRLLSVATEQYGKPIVLNDDRGMWLQRDAAIRNAAELTNEIERLHRRLAEQGKGLTMQRDEALAERDQFLEALGVKKTELLDARRGCADLAAKNRQLQQQIDRHAGYSADSAKRLDAARKAGFTAVAKGASDAELVRVLRADYASLQQRNEALSSNIQAYSRKDAKLREEKRQLQDQLAKSAEAKGALEANAIKLRQALSQLQTSLQVVCRSLHRRLKA